MEQQPTTKDYYKLMEGIGELLTEIHKELQLFRDTTPLSEDKKRELDNGLLWALTHGTFISEEHWSEAPDTIKFIINGLEDGRI